jgi:putative RecB family exonuclease
MPTYSHSRLSTFEQCPLKYKFSYIDGIKREEEKGIEAFLGSRVHDTLEKCYNDLRFTKLNTLKELLDYYDKNWDTNWNDTIFITRKELSSKDYRQMGRKFIENYYQRYAPFDHDITIGTEIVVNFPLDSKGKYKIMGYIDRLSKTKDETYGIHDYKTSAHLPTQEDVDNDRQLGFYHLGIAEKWPDAKNIKLIWHYLAFDKDLVSTRTKEQLNNLAKDTIKLVENIESARDFPANESTLCDWCEYPDLCPKRKHLYKVAALPVNEYLKEPGVVLVNKLVALRDKRWEIKKSADEKIEVIKEEEVKIEEALVKYAKKHSVEAVKGNDYQAKIKFLSKIKFPGKNEPERVELNGIIKNADKWEEVSVIDTGVLEDVVMQNLWTKDLIKKVMKYGRIEESESVSLAKLKEKEK